MGYFYNPRFWRMHSKKHVYFSLPFFFFFNLTLYQAVINVRRHPLFLFAMNLLNVLMLFTKTEGSALTKYEFFLSPTLCTVGFLSD